MLDDENIEPGWMLQVRMDSMSELYTRVKMSLLMFKPWASWAGGGAVDPSCAQSPHLVQRAGRCPISISITSYLDYLLHTHPWICRGSNRSGFFLCWSTAELLRLWALVISQQMLGPGCGLPVGTIPGLGCRWCRTGWVREHSLRKAYFQNHWTGFKTN